MLKYIILFFSVLTFLTACTGEDAPEGIIPQQQMIGLLTDVHLTDGSLYAIPQTPDSLYKYGTARYAQVFKKHHTTGKAFAESLKYYTTKPVLLVAMYDKVSKNIQAKVDSLGNPGKPSNIPTNKNAVPVK